MNKLLAFAKNTVSMTTTSDSFSLGHSRCPASAASSPTSPLQPTVPGSVTENRVEDLVSTMSGLFRRATNLLGLTAGVDTSQPRAQDGEIVYCKNNVCVHAPAGDGGQCNAVGEEKHHPGYLSLRCQDDEVLGKTMVLTWIPNTTLKKNPSSLQTTPDKSPVEPAITRYDALITMRRKKKKVRKQRLPHLPTVITYGIENETWKCAYDGRQRFPSGSSTSYSGEVVEHSEQASSSSVSATELGYTIVETPGAAVDKKGDMSLDLTSLHKSAEMKALHTEETNSSSGSSPSTSGPDSPDEDSDGTSQVMVTQETRLLAESSGDNVSSVPASPRDAGCGVFSVDLGLMRYVRLFYTDSGPGRSGQMVIASTESQYKVLHFHNGGLDRLEKVLEEWRFLTRQKSQKHEAAERFYKQYTVVRPRFSVSNRHPEEGLHNLVTAEVWRSYMSPDGRIEEVFLLRKAIFFGGLDPALRGEAWPFLLKYYTFESTLEERENLRNDKFLEYQEIRALRANMKPEEEEKFYTAVQCIVEKDVIRTDRRHPYYAGEDNGNLEVLKEILLNYAACHPETGYMQGMSDLLAPILAEVRNQSDAYWCFEGLMQRTIFVSSPKDNDMDLQLGYLRELMRLTVPEFTSHLANLGDDATDLLFCHRWILLCFKREFGEKEALRLWEACWAHYQTDYFHLFVCVAIIQVYGGDVLRDRLTSDEMLLYFASLAMHMDVDLVLMQARWTLHMFRSRATIPCSLSELCLLCGPGMWDSRHVPAVQCVGHPDDAMCPHQTASPASPPRAT